MPLLKRENLLALDDIFQTQCLKLYYKIINKRVPDFFENIIDFTMPHTYPTRSNVPEMRELRVPFNNTRAADKRLRVYLPKLFNSTPRLITDKVHTHSLNGFVHYIKITKINSYQESCFIENCYICKNA